MNARVGVAATIAGAGAIGLALTLALSFVLWRFTDPPGVDGYFYLKQVRSLAAGEGFYFRDRSLAFFAPAALAALGVPALDALRVCTAATWALLLLGAAALAATLVRPFAPARARLAATAALVPLVAADVPRELALEYGKTALSMLFLLGATIAWLGARTRTTAALTALCAIAALLAHRSALLWLSAFALAWLLQGITLRRALIAAGGAITAGLVFFAAFDGALAFFMAGARFLVSPAARLSWLRGALPTHAGFTAAVVVCGAAFALYPVVRRHLASPARVVGDTGALLALVAALPILEPGPTGFTYRLVLAAPLWAVPLLCAAPFILGRAPPLAAGVAALLVASCAQLLSADPTPRFFSGWSALDDDIGALRRFVTDDDLLLAQHGLEFYIADRTGLRARQFVRAGARDQQQRVFRLARLPDGADDATVATLREHALVEVGPRHALYVEEDWASLQTRFGLPPDPRNPTAVRPAFVSDY